MTSRFPTKASLLVAALAVLASGCDEVVKSPTMTAGDVSPDLFCGDQPPTSITIDGTGFAALPTKTLEQKDAQLVLPKVEFLAASSFDGVAPATSSLVVADDPANPGASGLHFVSDTQLRVDLAKGQLAPGVYDVRVTNPDDVTTATWPAAVAVVPAPELEGFDEKLNALACLAEEDQTRTVTGKWFARVDDTLPTVSIDGAPFEVTELGGCTAVTASIANKVELCKSITFKMPKDSLAVGVHKLAVKNPEPVACEASKTLDVGIVPPPSILDLVPNALCADGAAQTVQVEGDGFVVIGTAGPELTLGGMAATQSAAPGDCTPFDPTFPDVTVCKLLTLDVPATLAAGEYEVAAKNPAPVACSAVSPVALSIAPIPTITSVEPQKICSGGGAVTITGADFWVDSKMNNPTVTLKPQGGGADVSATAVVCKDCDPKSNVAGKTLEVQFGPGATPGVTYEVAVTNPGGCDAPGPLPTITVELGPQLFLADPFTVPNQINTRITLYTTKLVTPLPTPAAWIIPSGQMMPIVELAPLPIDPAFPKRLQVTVPKGTMAGKYDVYLQDGSTCPATMLKDGLTITDKEDLTLASVSPPFGAVATNTAITIFRDTMKSKASFVATPRVYLNPAKSSNPPADAKSILLASTSFIDKDKLTALVPANTPAGVYDILVVNPDPTAEVGILYDGYSSVTAPPPVIANVVPPSIKALSNQPVELQGDDFRAGVKVSATCVNAAKQPVAPPVVQNAAPTCNAQGKACVLPALINGGTLNQGDVCVLRATNSDTTFGVFSAVGVTNSSLNIQTPSAGVDMIDARRGLGSAAAKATAAARFLYAIAGDDGNDANTKSDVESISVDLFGTMGKAWSKQKYALKEKRAFFGTAQTPRYVYVVGGTSGGLPNALQSAERAQVLDPLESPVITDVDFSYDQLGSTGLEAGEWIYRVAAEYSATDPHNPAGEGLPSDPLIIKLPMGSKLGITIYWKAPADCLGMPLPNVAKYHVYRTPTAGSGSGTEQHVAEVDGSKTSYTDLGAMPDATHVPLPLGSTGKWATLPALGNGKERNGVSAVVGVDPTNPSTKRYLYALFGRSKTTTLNTYQLLPITVDACGHETVNVAWVDGSSNGGQVRMNAMSWLVDRSIRSDVGLTTNYIYVAGGVDNANGQLSSLVRATVGANGDLGLFTTLAQSLSGGGANGAGVLAAAEQLFLFGGKQGSGQNIVNKGVSASILDASGNLAPNSWNAGLDLLNPRVYMGSSVQSAFAFFLGGQTPAALATKSTELVVW